MIEFDKNGMLVPARAILISVDEFKFHFIENIPFESRKLIFERYLNYTTELKATLEVDSLFQWINGSFVTTIPNPADIDVVTFVDFKLRQKFQSNLRRFEALHANAYFGVDGYLVTTFPENHESRFLFDSDRAYWLHQFTRTRRNPKNGKRLEKGFLEVYY